MRASKQASSLCLEKPGKISILPGPFRTISCAENVQLSANLPRPFRVKLSNTGGIGGYFGGLDGGCFSGRLRRRSTPVTNFGCQDWRQFRLVGYRQCDSSPGKHRFSPNTVELRSHRRYRLPISCSERTGYPSILRMLPTPALLNSTVLGLAPLAQSAEQRTLNP